MVKFLQNTPCKVLICLTGILSRQACVSSGEKVDFLARLED